MRVGITCAIEHSMYSSGSTNTALAVAELCKTLGYEATLINIRGSQTWWEDCTPLKKIFPVVHVDDIKELTFNILFEIGNHTVTLEQRTRIASFSIWILRKAFALQEIESSIFPIMRNPRNVEGIREAWLMEDVTDINDRTILETITRVPVRHIPYVWTPLISEVYLRSTSSPPWKGDAQKPFSIKMADTNVSSSSSSTIPLVILHELEHRKYPVGDWKLHNGEGIVKSKFFCENVLKHCTKSDMSGCCVGRQRCVNWTNEENSVAFVNLRFHRLRPILLDLAWAGIPVIHNSPAFREIGNGTDRFYYHANSISGGANAFENLRMDLSGGTGWFDPNNTRREQVLRRWSPVSGYVKTLWKQAISSSIPSVMPIETPIPSPSQKTFRVVFTDMWDSFVPEYNFFTLLLNQAGKSRVEGYADHESPDLVIFGPFGDRWKSFSKSIPKIHFTGENTRPVFGEDVRLSLGFDYIDVDNYIRFPLWMTYIDWFGADANRLQNPKPISLDLCMNPPVTERKKFCAFVVTNPTNPVRNNAFKWLSAYKDVDSAGNLYNNMGNVLPAPYPGGGGGEHAKVEFYRDYKFCLTYENSSYPGYSTEKFLHAKAAGSVPIYWGNPLADTDFDMEGAIDARNFRSPKDLCAAVEAVDTNDEVWKKKAATPFMKPETVEKARKLLSVVAERIWGVLESVPPVLPVPAIPISNIPFTPEVPIVITYTSWNFLGSLNHWLSAIQIQTQALPQLTARIFHADDIPTETIKNLQTKYPFAVFELVPTEAPVDFPDFWDPPHYAWKLWVFHTMATRSEFKDKMCFYMDAGAVLCKWPMEWLRVAQESGLSFLEDPRQENSVWSTQAFCKVLSVTEKEREAKQIWGGSVYFRSGHELAVRFFTEAYRLAQIRSVLVGPRLSGYGVDGNMYGHRQDQSILSILVRRFPVPLMSLDSVYCDHSMRKTLKAGCAIYVHRGTFTTHIPILPGIDDAFIINLDRRSDRLDKFFKTHPDLLELVTRWQATDGKTLQMKKELATLFQPNDFFWKKSVMGCAMSHLGLWWKLVNEQIEIKNYLIFEDDAKLVKGWKEILLESMNHLPENYDVLYLGGILPPNRQGFESILEPVTKYYSRIKPNTFFGQKEPTPYFHSCAYAYILSRRGAMKIINMLFEKSGYWTSADHIMCGPNSDLDVFFLTPTIAGCYQDEDPKYASSQFNNFSRIDSFDSDLWNNDERFTKEEILEAGIINDIPIGILIDHALSKTPLIQKSGPRFVHIKSHPFSFEKLYERDWLFSLNTTMKNFPVEPVDHTTPIPTDVPIFILQRPFTEEATKIMKVWSNAGAKFKILHLSDESIVPKNKDSLIAYTLVGCVSILRFYIRNDFPPEVMPKINVIPLGYRWSSSENTLETKDRKLHWSFFGTGWQNRVFDMKPLTDSKLLHKCKFLQEWNDKASLSKEEYLEEMRQSIFVPCPGGQNPETFRFYEALQSGCIPLVIKTEENEEWFNWVSDKIPLVVLNNWTDALRIMSNLLNSPDRLRIYREKILTGWSDWTDDLKKAVKDWIQT